MGERKLCPLKKGSAEDFLALCNVDLTAEDIAGLKNGKYSMVRITDGGEQRVEVFFGSCDGSRCAWWNAEKECCGVVCRRAERG